MAQQIFYRDGRIYLGKSVLDLATGTITAADIVAYQGTTPVRRSAVTPLLPGAGTFAATLFDGSLYVLRGASHEPWQITRLGAAPAPVEPAPAPVVPAPVVPAPPAPVLPALVVPAPVEPAPAPVEPAPVVYGTVHGIVTDRDGRPLEGIRVELRSDPRVTFTDARGWYFFTDVPLGRHTVTLLDAASLREYGRVDVIVDGIRTADADRSLIALDLERREQRVDFAVTPFPGEPLPRTSGRSILPAALLLAALTLRFVVSRQKRRATRPVVRR